MLHDGCAGFPVSLVSFIKSNSPSASLPIIKYPANSNHRLGRLSPWSLQNERMSDASSAASAAMLAACDWSANLQRQHRDACAKVFPSPTRRTVSDALW